MKKRRTGLGKGLDALIPSTKSEQAETHGIREIPTRSIQPNPHQPRHIFQESELNDLAQSIREHGILQPLIVSKDTDEEGYTLIAGERRLQAARLAGLDDVPVVVRTVTDQEQLELALIENVQRSDLSALEKASAFKQLADEFNLTHDQIAASVGVSRVSVTNTIRLLNLPQIIKDALAEGKISEGHARVLLSLPTLQAQSAAFASIIKNQLNVRQTEELVKKMLGEKKPKKSKKPLAPELVEIEEKLRTTLGTRVRITHGAKGGTITLHYYSNEELESLVNHILNER